MSKRRKIVILALIICMTMLLCACSSSGKKTISDTAQVSSDIILSSKSQNLTAFASENIFSNKSYNSKGYYEIVNPLYASEGNNILFTDFETKLRVYLCNRVNCLHDNEACTSFVKGSAKHIMLHENNIILLQGAGNDPNNPIKFIKISENGDSKTDIYELEANQMGGRDCIIGNDYIFTVIYEVQPNNDTKKYLLKIDIKSGKASKILDMSSDEFIAGAYGDNIIIQENRDNISTLYEIDVDGNKLEKNQYPKWNMGERTYKIFGDKMYSISLGSSPRMIVETLSSYKYEEHKIDIAGMKAGYVAFGWEDERIVTFAALLGEMEAAKTHVFVFDKAKSQIAENNLEYKGADEKKRVSIVAEYGKNYLVENGSTNTKITDSKNGVTMTHDVEISTFAIISKDDYINSKENYENIMQLDSGNIQ